VTLSFVFNERKAAQAAAYLVQLNAGQMNVLSLIKILYLADRKSLILRGRPITGDRMVSMPHGPVLSRIYDEIKWGAQEGGRVQPWYEYLTERQSHDVSLQMAPPTTDELSDFERGILEETHRSYGHLSPWDLRRITHELPEYQDPQGSSLPINPEIILREAGWSEPDIQEAVMSATEEIFLHHTLSTVQA
jgi:uncharacterized phage-associated protein